MSREHRSCKPEGSKCSGRGSCAHCSQDRSEWAEMEAYLAAAETGADVDIRRPGVCARPRISFVLVSTV